MASRDTVAGTPPSDWQPHANNPGPDPAAPTVTAHTASTPGPNRSERSTSAEDTEEARVLSSRDTVRDPELPAIPGYRVLGVLGRGGMGTVYAAVQLEMDREVALKLISPGGRDPAAVRSRFTREVRALARIEHPNIVPVYDAGDWQGFPYYTMKLVPNGALSRHLERFRTDIRAAVQLVAKVARAIGALHTSGVLHRDLKPLNILLGDNDEPLVADFGLARWIGDATGLTDSGSPVGTRPYMSPEQSLGSKTDYTPACDIWAIGIILYEVFTGHRPFEAEDPVELYLKIRGEPALPASSLNPRVAPVLDAVIARCLAKRPDARYPTADALADDLERWLAGEPFEVPVPPEPPVPVRRRRRWVASAVGLAVIGAVIVGAVFWPKPEASTEPPSKQRTIAEQLAAGDTVVLIGETGLPLVEYRRVTGFDDTLCKVRNGFCTLTSTQYGAIELVFEPLPCAVLLETEVALLGTDPNTSEAGLYVTRQEIPFGGVVHQTEVTFTHKQHGKVLGNWLWVEGFEITSTAAAEVRWLDPRPRLLGGRESSRLGEQMTTAIRAEPFEPRWHTWNIRITPKDLTAIWDREQFEVITTTDVGAKLAQLVTSRARRVPRDSLPTFTPRLFGPGIGLSVRQGDAVFRNTRLIPVK